MTHDYPALLEACEKRLREMEQLHELRGYWDSCCSKHLPALVGWALGRLPDWKDWLEDVYGAPPAHDDLVSLARALGVEVNK